jgi:hypothetical protein
MGHSRWTLALCAAAFVAAGVFPLLDALGYFPASESRMNAPRWVIFIVAGLFLAAGVYLFLLAAVGEAKARAYGSALGIAIFAGLAAVAHWIAFGEGGRSDCSGGFSSPELGFARGVPDTECRLAFGYGALLMDFMFLRGAAWWYALRHPQSRRARALERVADGGLGLMLLPLFVLVILLAKAREGTGKLIEKMRNKDAGSPPAGGSG